MLITLSRQGTDYPWNPGSRIQLLGYYVDSISYSPLPLFLINLAAQRGHAKSISLSIGGGGLQEE